MPWYDKDEKGKQRLVLEYKAMQESFPQFTLEKNSQNALYWKGNLSTQIKDKDGNIKFPGNIYSLHIIYPNSYPDDPPIVNLISPKIPTNTPHLRYRNPQQLCLYHPQYAKRVGMYNPALSTVVNIIGHIMNWLISFEIWQTTKEWIVPESPTR